MNPLRNVLATACISAMRTAKTAACFSMLPNAMTYDSYIALFPNATTTKDEKTFQAYIVQCKDNDKSALSYGYHDWTNM